MGKDRRIQRVQPQGQRGKWDEGGGRRGSGFNSVYFVLSDSEHGRVSAWTAIHGSLSLASPAVLLPCLSL